MTKAFVIAETESAIRGLSAGARQVADEVELIALADDQVVTGVADKVLKVSVPAGSALDDAYETVIALYEAEKPAYVFVEPTIRLKAVAGRLAARLGASVLTDVLEFADGNSVSLYFGGIAQKTQKSTTDVSIYTTSAKVFQAFEPSGTDVVEDAAYVAPRNPITISAVEELVKSDVNLLDAKRIVSAGRGFAAEEDLDLARQLGAKIGGELACSRPLTETEHWLPREVYIGVSGLTLTPDVFVGVGVSGQMQHMIGINRSKLIFAINKDKSAPIFKQTDFGLIGDLYKVLPEITAAL
jgi:electron transfer flavoprotein alpha subunit